ncbi:MAG: molybdate ABC transporter substrate-binding protein [Betaproteobacteria bacterium]|nr:molybdate ABC transporter substrate-binding protein [Betaproteobacteria bacterium]
MKVLGGVSQRAYRRCLRALLLLAGMAAASGATAAEVKVAVAANFSKPLQTIAAAFERATGHRVSMTAASTGKLYAQIRNGAPFAVFLAAETTTPARLEAEGLGVPGSRFTYATGTLLLWSPDPAAVDAEGQVLRQPGRGKIALAHSRLAPYGHAAAEALTALGLWETLTPRFVWGENVGQTYQFVASGNAALGFISASQVTLNGRLQHGSAWSVPQHLYTPIHQDALLLQAGADNPAAKALLRFLREPAARAILNSYGYR